MKIPKAAWAIAKEAARHVLRRPVVAIAALARTHDGRVVLIRRVDTGQWALPGGTIEWGETLQTCIRRELAEEAGVEVINLGKLLGVYSRPDRDFRFHAITVVIEAKVTEPLTEPSNPLEIREVSLFEPEALPSVLSHEMTDVLRNAMTNEVVWE